MPRRVEWTNKRVDEYIHLWGFEAFLRAARQIRFQDKKLGEAVAEVLLRKSLGEKAIMAYLHENVKKGKCRCNKCSGD